MFFKFELFMLQMNVTGRNLGAACKLIYQTSKVGKNDELFLQEELIGEIFISKINDQKY